MAGLRRAVFLDRDGVLNEPLVRDGKPYPPDSLAEFRILPEVRGACEKLYSASFLLIVVTNQPDVGRGTQSEASVHEMHAFLQAELPMLDRVECCFHPGGEVECDCRKPKPGMLTNAADALGIDLAASFMVGDRWRDIDCGVAAGCQTIFIDRHYDEALRKIPDVRVEDLAEAAEWILRQP